MFKLKVNSTLDFRSIGDNLTKQGKYKEAIDAYNRAIELQPCAVFYNQRGLAKVQLGEYDAAYNDFVQANKLMPSCALYAANIAWVSNSLGNYQEAIEWGRKAIQLDKALYTGYSQIARAYQFLGRYKESLTHYGQAIALNKTEHRQKAIDLNSKGLTHIELCQYHEALALCFDALNIYTSIKDNIEKHFAACFYSIGICYEGLCDFEKAVQYFEKSLEYQANDTLAINGLARCLFGKLEYGKAIQLCEEAIKISPEYYHTYSLKGCIYLDTKEFQQAYFAFDKAAQLAYNDSLQHALLGFSRLLCKQTGFAQDIFQKLLKNLPKKEANVPEYYSDNEMANRALNKETSSFTTEAAEKLCQFGSQCVAFLSGTVNEIVDKKFKDLFIDKTDSNNYCALLVGFVQVYSDELMKSDTNKFIQLCDSVLQIVEKYHENDKSPRMENLVSRVKEFISIANKRMGEVRTPYTKPTGKLNENTIVAGLQQKLNIKAMPKPTHAGQPAQVPSQFWPKVSSPSAKSQPVSNFVGKPVYPTVVALYDFVTEETDELSFKKGEFLMIREKTAEWWMAENSKGQSGYVPANYLTPSTSTTYFATTSPKPANTQPTPASAVPGGFWPKASSFTAKSQSLSTLAEKPVGHPTAHVIYNYATTDQSELSLKVGEVLKILDQTSEWWWVENSKGQRGYVPSNYLELQKATAVLSTIKKGL